MRTRRGLRLVLALAALPFGPAAALAVDAAPELVSPLAARGESRVDTLCPTLSWTNVEGASGYELVVYGLPESGAQPGSGQDAAADPVLRRTLPRGAATWTPTIDECLPRAGRYSWAVGARGQDDQVAWAEPGLFRVVHAGAASGRESVPLSAPPSRPSDDDASRAAALNGAPRSLAEPTVFLPPPCGAAPFSDVPATSPYCPFIRQLVGAGISAGCGGGKYCPQGAVTREQLAMFLARVLRSHGAREITAGLAHTCAVLASGRLACWGANGFGQATPPNGTFVSVSAGAYQTCGVRTDGTVACWGDNTRGQATPQAGTFWSVSAGDEHTCGVQPPGALLCWGSNIYGQATPPVLTFVSVSAGGYHTCGVDEEGILACWGDDSFGQATAPAGTFSSVSAGLSHSCAFRTDGSLVCWGDNRFGQTKPPAAAFASVSAGNWHTCGVKTDGTLACWGNSDFGMTNSPAGTFTSVWAGAYHSCAVASDGTVACWGHNADGQAAPPGWL